MLISVTDKDIAIAAPLPCTSPIAQAIKRITGDDAVVNHCAVYINGDRFELPAIAKQQEIAFDYFKKTVNHQGIHLAPLEGYEFELLE